MKKLRVALVAFLGMTVMANAQPGSGFQRRTPEERTASIHAKLDSAFKLEASKLATLDTALIALYKAQDKKREELMAGGNPDRETMMAEMKKFSDAHDEIMKAVLTADQFTIWKEKIQPSMRPQRQQSSGNR
jgi:hypothetical protein